MTHQLPTPVLHVLREFRMLRAKIASEHQRWVFANHKPACHKGCIQCCHYPVYITVLEGLQIYQWLVENRRWCHELREQFVKTEDRTWGLSIDIWLVGCIPCPLLKDKLCQGYECRPLYCRTMFVQGDPYYCYPHRSTKINSISKRSSGELLIEAEKRLLKRLRAAWCPTPFATAVLLGERIYKGEMDLRECNPLTLSKFRRW